MSLSAEQRSRLKSFCLALVDQSAAKIIVEPQARESGFWFGGGNMIQSPDGTLSVVGRFRNAGDSRTGVAAGTRGLELAIFSSTDRGHSFQKVASWDKAALNSASGEVLSIEGSCLRLTESGAELYVSTEKIGVPYPAEVADFLKPGAGVWTIDVLRGPSIAELRSASVQPAFRSRCPGHLHVKDPFFWSTGSGDRLGYCSHPFGWSSSNTGVADLPAAGQEVLQPQHSVFPRGQPDVAITRGTCVLPVPAVGLFADADYRLLFYCGGECLRPMEEHGTAVKRPRGYSCEEIGGAAVIIDDDIAAAERLSDLLPLFISPTGTGCSRYVDVLSTPEGFYTTWQQSQPDLSQPLVMTFLPAAEAGRILTGS
ncbi:MAG: hypothetical protein R3C49_03585 [Planctomycetaceae bacterium]